MKLTRWIFDPDSCVYTSVLDDVIETMQYLPWAGTSPAGLRFGVRAKVLIRAPCLLGFAALRVYALSRSRIVAMAVFVLSIVTVVVNMVSPCYVFRLACAVYLIYVLVLYFLLALP